MVAHTRTEEARVAASRGDTQVALSSLAQVNAALHDKLQPATPAGVLRKVKVTLSRTTRLYATWLTTSGSHQVQVSCCCCDPLLLLFFVTLSTIFRFGVAICAGNGDRTAEALYGIGSQRWPHSRNHTSPCDVGEVLCTVCPSLPMCDC